RLAWAISFARMCWWGVFLNYTPLFLVSAGIDPEIGGLAGSIGNGFLFLTPIEIHFPNRPVSHRLPIPPDSVKQLLAAAQVRLPSKVVAAVSGVTTKTKLTDRRK